MPKPTVTCEDVLKDLLAYIDRETDANTAAEIERHLKECRGCFSRAEFERMLKAKLRAAGSRTAPGRLRARIRKLVDEF
ncbi:MAG TPA: zf-HC2 domain-containing protein [Burkholderiales bacterium]